MKEKRSYMSNLESFETEEPRIEPSPIETEPSYIGEPKKAKQKKVTYIEGNDLITRGYSWTLSFSKSTGELPNEQLEEYFYYKEPLFLSRESTEDEPASLALSRESWRLLSTEDKKNAPEKAILMSEISRRAQEGSIDSQQAIGILAFAEHLRMIIEPPKSGDGSSPANPVKRLWIWSSMWPRGRFHMVSTDSEKGNIMIATKKMEANGHYRKVEIIDQQGNLMEGGWDLLRSEPGKYANIGAMTSTEPQNKDGKWRVDYRADNFYISTAEHQKMQETVLTLTEGHPNGQHATEVVRGLLAARQATKEFYEIRTEKIEDRRNQMIKDLDVLVEDESEIKVSSEDLLKHVGSLELPYGANIKNTAIQFSEPGKCTLSGIINVPIPFVGGDVNFTLSLTNDQEDNLMVSNAEMKTTSNTLKSRLGQIEGQFENIGSLLLPTINGQLRNNGAMSIGLEEKGFVFRVKPKKIQNPRLAESQK